MKHHRSKAPFAAVQYARWLYDNTMLGYELIAELINDLFQPKELEQNWDKPRPRICEASTVRDWIDSARAVS